MELYDETVYSVYDFIECINSNYFPYCLRLSGETEWRIAAEYLPEGNTKTMVKAIVLNKLDGNRAEAIKIVKESFEKDPEYLMYELFNSLVNSNYLTQEEEQAIYEKLSNYHDVKFKVQVRPKSLKDIVGEKFVLGCLFYNEILQIYQESESLLKEYNTAFEKVLLSENSKEMYYNLINLISTIKKDNHNILNNSIITDCYLKIYNLLGDKPELYCEGVFQYIEFCLNLRPYSNYERNHSEVDNHPSTIPLIKVVTVLKIANDEILHFLYCLSNKDNLDDTRTENLILYSKIFEIQGFPKASKKYLEIASRREDYAEKLLLFK